jgi:hypothetical protein
VDGETLRGAVDTDGAQVHLMAAATHGDQLVLGQVEVGAKTNEKQQRLHRGHSRLPRAGSWRVCPRVTGRRCSESFGATTETPFTAGWP